MLTLVIPVYRNEGNLPDLLVAIAGVNTQLDNDLEVVFVVDGSPDRCYEILREKLPSQPFRSKLILLSKNFGSFMAIRTGLQNGSGDRFAVMAADLQEPPELVLEMNRVLLGQDTDVVVGVREGRQDPWGSRMASYLFWGLYRRYVIPEIPPGGVDMFACNRAFRDTLLTLDERHSSLIAQIFWLGYRRKVVTYTRQERVHGTSAWTLRKKVNYLMDSVFSFTDLPIRLLTRVGAFGSVLAAVFGLFTLAAKLHGMIEVPGYAMIMLTITFLGCLNLLGLGIVGSYAWRTYENTKIDPWRSQCALKILETRMVSTKQYFVHSHALCESENIGKDTRVWAFAHILPGATLGSECNVCDNVFIENDVIIGDRVTLKCGVQVWDGITIEDDVFIGPNATFTNDLFPRSKVYPQAFDRTIVRKGASLGANCTILPGLTIGINAMIGAGAVVTRSIPPNAIVVGNPAKIIGYVDAKPVSTSQEGAEKVASKPGMVHTTVNGVTLHTMTEVADIRGSLSAGEFERTIPFKSERYFLVYDVPTAETRGEHAHKICHQFLVAVKGSVHVVADDGSNREEFVLDKPNKGIHLPPMTWGIQYRYSHDAVLMVFASHYYDSADYIRNYDEFKSLIANAR